MKSFIMQPEKVKHHGNHVASTDKTRYLVQDCQVTDDWKLVPWSGYTVSLSVSSSSVTYGTSITLTATVLDDEDDPVSSGTVTFYDGTTSIGTGTTNSSGVATLSTSSLGVGSHSITAVCSGASSSNVSVTVSKITSTLSLSAASSTVIVGSDVSLSGTLSVGAGESVKIYQGTTLIDTVTTGTNGAFSKTVSGLSVGTYSFKAVYDGDSTHTDVTSSTVSVTVADMSAPTITLAASSSSITVGNSVTLSGTLSYSGSALASKSVKIYNGNTLVDTVTTGSNGGFSKSVSGLSVGSHSFTAVFEGDSTYAGVTSSAVSVTVSKITSTISLSAASSSVTVGSDVSLSGTLSVGSGASVKIYQGSTLIDTVTTGSGGAFTKTVSGLSVGSYTFKAVYDGDSTHTDVTSSNVSVTVNKITSTISLSAVSSTINVGESAQLTGTLSVGSGKTVYITDGDIVLSTVTTGTNGAFTYTGSATSSTGTLTFQAYYEGDSTHSSVNSSAVSISVVAPTPSSISLTSDKSILSYADSESAILTATHSKGTGQTIGLYDASDDSLLGGMTDNLDGTYSYTYNSQAIGDLEVYASDGSVVSVIFSLEDALLHDVGTTGNKSNGWTSVGSVTEQVLATGTKLSSSVASDCYYKANPQLTGDFSVEFTLVDAYSWEYMLTLLDSSNNKIDRIIGYNRNASSKKFTIFKASYGVVSQETFSHTLPVTIKLERDGSSLKYYENGTLKATTSISTSDCYFAFIEHSDSNRYTTFKDLKIKAL